MTGGPRRQAAWYPRLSSCVTCCALLSLLGDSGLTYSYLLTSHSPGIMDLDPRTVCDHGAQSFRGVPNPNGRRTYTLTRARRTHTHRPLDRYMLLLVIGRVLTCGAMRLGCCALCVFGVDPVVRVVCSEQSVVHVAR